MTLTLTATTNRLLRSNTYLNVNLRCIFYFYFTIITRYDESKIVINVGAGDK